MVSRVQYMYLKGFNRFFIGCLYGLLLEVGHLDGLWTATTHLEANIQSRREHLIFRQYFYKP